MKSNDPYDDKRCQNHENRTRAEEYIEHGVALPTARSRFLFDLDVLATIPIRRQISRAVVIHDVLAHVYMYHPHDLVASTLDSDQAWDYRFIGGMDRDSGAR